MQSEGSFSAGKISVGKVAHAPEGGNGQAAFAEKALPLAKMSNNALFLSRLVKGAFLRENFLQEMLKSGLTIGPFLSYLLEGLLRVPSGVP